MLAVDVMRPKVALPFAVFGALNCDELVKFSAVAPI